LPENFGDLSNCYTSEFYREDVYQDDIRWKRSISVLAWYKGCAPHEVFDDPDWPETIIFDLDIAMFFWNEVYSPMIQNRRGAM